MQTVFRLCLICAITTLFSCGGGSGNSNNNTVWKVELAFSRVDNPSGLDPFTVDATILRDGSPTAGLQPLIQLGRGTHDAVSDLGDGRYRFTVTPDQTGEYPVTVSFETGSLTRTALVLKSVHADWGQPMSVPGLVNTEGYEDGATITPDGQYLFVQTGPQYFSGLFVFLAPRANGGCGGDRLNPVICHHPWLDTLPGTYTAPERPGFFDGRFSGSTFLHNSNAFGIDIDQAPIFAFATMFYGFKKQPDGSFSEPFYVAFDDLNDAIANPFGMSFRMNADGSATMIFAHNDGDPGAVVDQDNDNLTAAVDSGFDVYTLDITPGQNTSLGQYTVGNPPVRGSFFPSAQVNFDKTGTEGAYGTQGNPHLYVLNDGSIDSIWTDDEFDGDDADPGNDSDIGDLSVYTLSSGSFPNGNWSKTVLPATVNAGGDQVQPFFTGTGLYYSQDTDILYSAYSGTDTASAYASNTNWAAPVTVLEKDAGNTPLGRIVAIGEPTIADDNGAEVLYFIYGYVRAVDASTGIADINLQAGFIQKK